MPLEKIFSTCGMVAMLGWLLLSFVQRWKWTARFIAACVMNEGGLIA